MRVIHRAVPRRLVGHSNLRLGMTECSNSVESRSDRQQAPDSLSPLAQYSQTPPHISRRRLCQFDKLPLAILAAPAVAPAIRYAPPPDDSSDTSAGPPSLITTSTPHRNIQPISNNRLRQHLLTTSKPTYRGLNVCPRRSFPSIKASIAHHGCATERRALPHRRPH